MTYELIHGPLADPTTRKGQIARGAMNGRDHALDRARLILNAAIERANLVFQNKLRMAYGVPYHEWQDALSRGQLYVDHLLTVYEPSYVPPQPAFQGDRLRIGRCPPWATRRYWQAALPSDATATISFASARRRDRRKGAAEPAPENWPQDALRSASGTRHAEHVR